MKLRALAGPWSVSAAFERGFRAGYTSGLAVGVGDEWTAMLARAAEADRKAVARILAPVRKANGAPSMREQAKLNEGVYGAPDAEENS